MLLCRENPSATRVRPSRGDGGIDVLCPNDDGSYDVYQVKCFSSNLTSGQKAQITRSFKRIQTYATTHSMRIRNWYLTLPLDPTPENRIWFAKTTKHESIHSEWRGLSFVDMLAAQYPAIIDYYLRDGKGRLEESVATLSTVIRSLTPGGVASNTEKQLGQIAPPDVEHSILAVHKALNEFDPHYRFDYTVSQEPFADISQPLLVAVTHRRHEDRYVTFYVFARCMASLEERPIPLNINISRNINPEFDKKFEEFAKFGTDLDIPEGVASITHDLPGGLSEGTIEFVGRIAAIANSKSPREKMRLQVIDSDGDVLAETLAEFDPSTSGPTRKGLRRVGYEVNGVFEYEQRFDEEKQEVTFMLRHKRLDGKAPADLLSGLNFIKHLHEGNTLRLCPPFGPTVNCPTQRLDGFPHPDSDIDVTINFMSALIKLQEVTTTQIIVPDLDTITRKKVAEVISAAELISGNVKSSEWEAITMHLRPEIEEVPIDPISIVGFFPLIVTLGEEELHLGYKEVTYPSAILDPETMKEHDDHKDVTIAPLGDTPALIRYRSELPPNGVDA